MRIAKWIVLALLVVLVVGGIALYFNLNRIIRSTVETQATQSMNLQTRLGSASLALFGGQLSLSELQIASPQGYPAPEMFALDDVTVRVSFRQLRREPIHIAAIRIDRPQLVVEREGGKFNLQAAMDQMPPTDPADEPFRLIIEDLQVHGAVVTLRPGGLPMLPEELVIEIPPIVIENVGTGEGAENGVAIREVVMQVATVMAAKAAESDSIPEELRALLALDTAQIAAQLDAEFRKQFERVTDDLRAKLPADAAQILEQVRDDPAAAVRDQAREVERDVEQRVGEQLEGLRDLPLPRRERRDREPAPQPEEPPQ